MLSTPAQNERPQEQQHSCGEHEQDDHARLRRRQGAFCAPARVPTEPILRF
jgi:hypothetical protein